MTVIPVILSGGSGTRLWPLSRRSKPKQFLQFGSDRSLFQETILRCRGEAFDPCPIVVGAADHRFLMMEDLDEIEVAADILLEPVPRDSCAAIAAGCLYALERDRDAMVLVLAADHAIADTDAFAAAVELAVADAAAGNLVVFGVEPDRPATAYGYVLAGETLVNAAAVTAFVEKPSLALAERHVSQGYLWNSGNFLFRADAFLDELATLQPQILTAVSRSVAAIRRDLGFLRLEERAFAAAPAVSVDYAVMEKTAKAAVLPVDYAWSDIGSWDAVAEVLETDAHGNATVGDAMIVDGRGNLVHSDGRLTALVGADDMVVVATRDCVLVAPKSRAEEIKPLVARLDEEGRTQANGADRMVRSRGNEERLDAGDGYQVMRIVVAPGAALSLQRQGYGVGHWIVVRGRVEVTIGGAMSTLEADQSVSVPLGAMHRLANREAEPAILIEVQTGSQPGGDA